MLRLSPCIVATILFTSVSVSLSWIPGGHALAQGRIIYVNGSYTDDVEDGSSDHPYKSLTRAIEAAAAGDTIVITAGEYFESRISKKVSIRTSGGTVSLIPGQSGCQQWKVPPEFDILQDNPYRQIKFILNQNGSQLGGRAGYAATKPVIGNVVRSAIVQNRFSARVLWTFSGVSSIGVYSGTIDDYGLLKGSVYDEYTAVFGGWYSRQLMLCDFQLNTNHPGSDYRNFDLAQASYEDCRAACAAESRCRVYTYVKPGVQGPNAHCWLKATVPASQASNCCISGIIR